MMNPMPPATVVDYESEEERQAASRDTIARNQRRRMDAIEKKRKNRVPITRPVVPTSMAPVAPVARAPVAPAPVAPSHTLRSLAPEAAISIVCEQQRRHPEHPPVLAPNFCEIWENQLGEGQKESCGRTFHYANSALGETEKSLNPNDLRVCVDAMMGSASGNAYFKSGLDMQDCLVDKSVGSVMRRSNCNEFFAPALILAGNPVMSQWLNAQVRDKRDSERRGFGQEVKEMKELLSGQGADELSQADIQENARKMHLYCGWNVVSRQRGSENSDALMHVAETFYSMDRKSRTLCSPANSHCAYVNKMDQLCANAQRRLGHAAFNESMLQSKYIDVNDDMSTLVRNTGDLFVAPFSDGFDRIAESCGAGYDNPRRDVMTALTSATPATQRNICGRMRGTAGSVLKPMSESSIYALAMTSTY